MLVLLGGVAGCSRHLMIQMNRPPDLAHPVWVGVYFLNNEHVRDGKTNEELIIEHDSLVLEGLISKLKIAVKPNAAPETFMLKDDEFDKNIRWVGIVGGFPDSEECARKLIPVFDESKIDLSVTVLANCIEVTRR